MEHRNCKKKELNLELSLVRITFSLLQKNVFFSKVGLLPKITTNLPSVFFYDWPHFVPAEKRKSHTNGGSSFKSQVTVTFFIVTCL